MTVEVLTSILICLCGNKATFIDKQECADPYVNCAVSKAGKLLTRQEFEEACTKTPAQRKCVEE